MAQDVQENISLILLIISGYNCFKYVANFNKSTWFQELIVPLILTWMTFYWVEVLSWQTTA